MTDVYDIYKEVLGKVNKEENGYLPADLFNGYARSAVRLTYNDYVARLQNPQTAAAEKMKLEDRMAPFDIQAPCNATGGLFAVPDDFAYYRSARIKGDGGQAANAAAELNEKLCEAADDPTINVKEIQAQLDSLFTSGGWLPVQLLDHDQVMKRVNSYVPGKKPTLGKPLMERATLPATKTTASKKGFQLFPSDDLSVYLNYYRRYALPKLVMKQDPATFELTYDVTNSSQFEFEEEAMTDIVAKICTDFAIYIREGGLFQMTQAEAKP